MLGFLLAGCTLFDGPRHALEQAKGAMDRGDLAAFEAVVDVDAVAPEIAETCAREGLTKDLADAQFRPADAFAGVGREIGDSLVTSAFDDPANQAQVAADFRARFPHAPDDCSAVHVDLVHATITRQDADHAVALLPVVGAPGAWRLDLARADGSWRVVGASGSGLVEAERTAQLAIAQEHALDLAQGLLDGGTRDDWEQLENYVDRHPEQTSIALDLDQLLAPFATVEPPLRTRDTGFFKPSGMFRNRHVGTRVSDPTPVGVRHARVRFTFTDADGDPAISGGGIRALVVETGPIEPGGSVWVASRAGGMSWPDAVGTAGTVIDVEWEDGTEWRHPAVEAGAWSGLPTDLPSE